MNEHEPITGIEKLPRSIQPEHDLWPGIAAGIQDGNVVRPRFNDSPKPPTVSGWRQWGLLAAAAMLLIVVSSGVTAYVIGRPTQPATVASSVEATPAAGPNLATVAWDEFQAAEREYVRVTGELLSALEERRDEFAPETVETVESSLRLIDQAIHDARSALERDPSNARLAFKLNDIYRKRVTFLRQMSRL